MLTRIGWFFDEELMQQGARRGLVASGNYLAARWRSEPSMSRKVITSR
jgi:hypothetical protein